jgi:hypothetical protein
MKKLLLIALILFTGNSMASSLPDCPSDQSKIYHDCFGAFNMANGSKYLGEWKDNKKHGQGTAILEGGIEKYTGYWKYDKKHGQGTNLYTTGDKYIGEWKDGKIHGQGTYISANGEKYVGEWQDGKQHGEGTFIMKFNGKESKYVGEFKNNTMHGKGTLKLDNITVRKGYFVRGEHVSDICEGIGLTKGSDPFGQCVVNLINEINKDF